MNIKKHKKYVTNAILRLARDIFPGIENADGSSSNTRIHPVMTCINMSKDENFNLCTCFLSVSLSSFSAFRRAENAISAQPYIRLQIPYSKRFWIFACWD
jgi:hypothetical protein